MATITAEFTGRQVEFRKVLPYLLSIVVLTGAIIAGFAVDTQTVVEIFDWLGLIVGLVLVAAAAYVVSGGRLCTSQEFHNLRNKDY